MGTFGFPAGKSRDSAPDPSQLIPGAWLQENPNEEITRCTWYQKIRIHLCSRPSHRAIPNIPTLFQGFRRGVFPHSPWRRRWPCCSVSCPAPSPPGHFFLPVLFPTSFDRELIAELWDYVCISKSFFLSWKVSSSKLGFPLHPLSPGVNPPFAGRVCLVSTHQKEEGRGHFKGKISVFCSLLINSVL